MKGVILAGGLGTRLNPLTKATNKHLLPVGAEPMLYHPIRQLAGAGVSDILVITSTAHMGDVVRCLGSGEEFGCTLSYKVQEHAGGIAHALALAEHFGGGERLCVILGDNIFEYSIAPYVDQFAQHKDGARVLLKQVGDPERYGVAALDEHQVIEIEEKPAKPKSSYAVVRLYFPQIEEAEIAEVVATLRSGWIGTGPKVTNIADKKTRLPECMFKSSNRVLTFHPSVSNPTVACRLLNGHELSPGL